MTDREQFTETDLLRRIVELLEAQRERDNERYRILLALLDELEKTRKIAEKYQPRWS